MWLTCFWVHCLLYQLGGLVINTNTTVPIAKHTLLHHLFIPYDNIIYMFIYPIFVHFDVLFSFMYLLMALFIILPQLLLLYLLFYLSFIVGSIYYSASHLLLALFIFLPLIYCWLYLFFYLSFIVCSIYYSSSH